MAGAREAARRAPLQDGCGEGTPLLLSYASRASHAHAHSLSQYDLVLESLKNSEKAAADPSTLEECVAANAKLIDTCREMIVAAYVAATKLQAAMRGRAERAAAGGKKGKGKKGKK